MGRDTPEENAAWAVDEGFQYELWTDDDGTLGLTYGALTDADDAYPKRITVVLDADGMLVLEYLEDISVGTHPGQVLEDVQLLFGD